MLGGLLTLPRALRSNLGFKFLYVLILPFILLLCHTSADAQPAESICAGSGGCNPASRHDLSAILITDGYGGNYWRYGPFDPASISAIVQEGCKIFAAGFGRLPDYPAKFEPCEAASTIQHSNSGGIGAYIPVNGRIYQYKASDGSGWWDYGEGTWQFMAGYCSDAFNTNLVGMGTDLHCYCRYNYVWYEPAAACVSEQDLDLTKKKSCLRRGNPIYPAIGVKNEPIETFLTLAGRPYVITYNNTNRLKTATGEIQPAANDPDSYGKLWFSSLHKFLNVFPTWLGAKVTRGDGNVVSFSSNSVVYSADVDINDRLSGYTFTDAANMAEEYYSASGKLGEVYYSNGQKIIYEYSTEATSADVAPAPGYLIRASDNFGRTINFTYKYYSDAPIAARISSISNHAGVVVNISYDSSGNLKQITWPDTTFRTFLYEDSTIPWALTGVIDERGIRYSTFSYDSDGRAVSTEHSGGVNKYSVTYTTPPTIQQSKYYDPEKRILYRVRSWNAPSGTVVTSPAGYSASWGISSSGNQPQLTEQSQPAGSGCEASSNSITYDANGNKASEDDFDGRRACFVHDLSRNLELVRVDGLPNTAVCSTYTPDGTPLLNGSRKTTTQWHPDWRLRARQAEPGKIVSWIYNGQPDPFNGGTAASCVIGNKKLPSGRPLAVVCKQVEQSTTDSDGRNGFNAEVLSSVPNRVRSWTYNDEGQMLTETDPRGRITTYTYYSDTTVDHTRGDLQSTTNPLNQTVTYDKYNSAGKLLQSTDANGVVTVNTYDARQRLLSSSLAGQLTSYIYDGAGLLNRVTHPDGSWISYEYDNAQRQKSIADNLGNRIEYVLDNMGNRIGQSVVDPAGVLNRAVSRTIDALGRVQRTIGRE